MIRYRRRNSQTKKLLQEVEEESRDWDPYYDWDPFYDWDPPPSPPPVSKIQWSRDRYPSRYRYPSPDLYPSPDRYPSIDLPPPPPVSKLVRQLENKINMVLEEILKLNNSPEIIGIQGRSGVGKTTLLKAIHGKLLMEMEMKKKKKKKKNSCGSHHDDFDLIVWVGVPGNTRNNIGTIQRLILREFGYSDDQCKNISQEERRKCIFQNLSTSNFVLLLDDVLEKPPLDFSGIGVPIHHLLSEKSYSSSSSSNSKIVFTTRSSSPTINNCFLLYDGGLISYSDLKMVELDCLSEEEGYELLVQTVGETTLSSHPDIPQLARQIISSFCYGLPLAIIAIGRYLAHQNYSRWEYTKQSLINSYQSRSITTDPNNSLFLMWELYIKGQLPVMSPYLKYFSLFPDYCVLNFDQLVDYWIGEEDIIQPYVVLYLLLTNFEHLKYIGFLLGEGNSVQIHSRFHEFALWMTANHVWFEENHLVHVGECTANHVWFEENHLVHVGECLTELLPSAQWKVAKRVSLMDNQIEQLSQAPECPELSTLILSKNPLKKIEDGFFQFMPSLRVLDLSWCMMGEIPKDIVSLVSLEYLNLSHTDIARLPIEFMNLKKLRVLDLSYMKELYAIPRKVLASLRRLRVLNTFHSCPLMNLIVEGSELLVGSKEFVEQLHRCSYVLERLGISIRDAQALEILQNSHRLQSSIHSVLILCCEGLTTLHLSSLGHTEQLRTFEVNDCEELEQIEFEQWITRVDTREYTSFAYLCYVKIERCWSLEELTWLFFIPNLQQLCIERCMNLKVVIAYHRMIQPSMSHSLRLKNIRFRTLPALTCFSNIGVSLPWLEEITVSYCPELKKFPIESISDDKYLKSIRGYKKWWDDLEWADESIKNSFLPYFEEIKS